jgi:hypothetical protein
VLQGQQGVASIRVAGEIFSGLNQPKRTPGENKKFAVAVRDPDSGNPVIVRFGDPSMENYRNGPHGRGGHGDEGRRADFKSRHNCADKHDKTTPGWWSCNWSWMFLGLVGVSRLLGEIAGLC